MNASPARSNEGFNGGGVVTTSKLLLFSFAALDNRNGQQIRVDAGVKLQNVKHFLLGFLGFGERSVTFLPEEFTSAEERSRMLEFPTLKIQIKQKFSTFHKLNQEIDTVHHLPQRCSTDSISVAGHDGTESTWRKQDT